MDTELLAHATTIVAAYVSNNATQPADVPKLIADAYAALRDVKMREAALKSMQERGGGAFRNALLYGDGKGGGGFLMPCGEPAVPIKKSVARDHIVCLEDGKKFKSLKHHLAKLGMTPDQYRAKWGLDSTYPMVCPDYSAVRSGLAKTSGLGQRRSA